MRELFTPLGRDSARATRARTAWLNPRMPEARDRRIGQMDAIEIGGQVWLIHKSYTCLFELKMLGTGGAIASRLDYRTGAVILAFSPGELYGTVPELADNGDAYTDAPTYWRLHSRLHSGNGFAQSADASLPFIARTDKRARQDPSNPAHPCALLPAGCP